MTTLESMARQRFEDYVHREKGQESKGQYDWNLLSKNRKLDWITEVYSMTTFVAAHWKSQIGSIPNLPDGIPTSYLVGFHRGIAQERLRNVNLIEDIDNALREEYLGIISGEIDI